MNVAGRFVLCVQTVSNILYIVLPDQIVLYNSVFIFIRLYVQRCWWLVSPDVT